MSNKPILAVVFFRTDLGREPVQDWLKDLDKDDRKTIGEDIKLVQFRWPLGMSLVRKMEADTYPIECKTYCLGLFYSSGSEMALLHGIIKKSQKTPAKDLKVARSRKDLWQSE